MKVMCSECGKELHKRGWPRHREMHEGQWAKDDESILNGVRRFMPDAGKGTQENMVQWITIRLRRARREEAQKCQGRA